MAYAFLSTYGKRKRSISAAAALLRGYHSVCPLTEQERKHLVLLIACRLACSVTLGAYSYQQNPGNEYLLLHSVPAWDTLDLIWGTDDLRRNNTKEMLDQIFRAACDDRVNVNTNVNTNDVIDCSDISFPDPSIGDPLSIGRVSFCKWGWLQFFFFTFFRMD